MSLVLIAILGGLISAVAQEGSPGIMQRTVFPTFNPNAPACSPPVGLKKVLTYVQENDRDFLQGLDHGLSMAPTDRGLEYRRILVENDVAKAIAQVHSLVDSLVAAKVGAMVATSPDPAAFSPALQQAIWSGAFVGTVVPPPATLLLNAPQYRTGKVLTDAAIDYINTKLGGKAKVVLLTQDTMEYLAPRFEAMRDGLNAMPGVRSLPISRPSRSPRRAALPR